MSSAWKPAQYDRFAAERRQPFRDLLSLVKAPVRNALDLGCGTGDTTAELHEALGATRTLGVDSSEEMLAKAAPRAGGGLSFRKGRIETFTPEETVDLVFSNAAIHWVPEHRALLPRLLSFLSPGGQLAIQLPAMATSASHTAAAATAAEEPFASALGGVTSFQTALEPDDYATILFELGALEAHVRLQIYPHALASREDVIAWVKGALLTGYEERLGPALFRPFLERYRVHLFERVADRRPFLYLYRRILIWARRPGA